MKFGIVNELTSVNRFVLHCNITHLAVITRKTNMKINILKSGRSGKEPELFVVLSLVFEKQTFASVFKSAKYLNYPE